MNLSHRSSEERAGFRAIAADAMRRDPTLAEEAMAALLLDMGVAYRFQCDLTNWETGKGVIVDFLLIDDAGVPAMCLEVDGPEHRKGPDARRDRSIWNECRLLTLRITNKEILAHPNKVRTKLSKALGW